MNTIARLALAAGLLLACAAPAVAQVPGATYTGRVGDATLTFKVGADGTRVTAYRVADLSADNCTFLGVGVEGEWNGAPIAGGEFEYHPDSSTLLRGRFDGPQSASGTLRLFRPEIAGERPACDTGRLGWTATTSATPPAPGAGAGPAQPIARTRPMRATAVSLRRGRTKLSGRLRSAEAGCRAGRTVRLRRGARTIAKTRTRAGGVFSFRRTRSTRGRRVRASIPERTIRTAVCAAGRSKSIRG